MEDDESVRVAVRIRPLIPREIIDRCHICTTVNELEQEVTLGNERTFAYNHVFDTNIGQENVYDTCVAPLIKFSLEGYNATVLAYGQTGSGKTYTMGSGFETSTEQMGIIPRAIHHLFSEINECIEKAKECGEVVPDFKITTQFIELYNEEIIDLFNPAYSKDKVFKIHEDGYGTINIKGVTCKTVASVEDTLQCLKLGALSRTTASTQMNTHSSRSHAIFTLCIKQQRVLNSNNTEEMTNELETLTSKFHFVDLAGSERLKRTGATGDRQKEGISINCGLLALGNVISALSDKTKRSLHVPYRDSKLTRLLQDSLGGNSKTIMIACVSPSDVDFMETLNTLRYASRARNIVNRIFVNQDKSSSTILQLKQQIAQLQLELFEYKQGKRIVRQDGTEMINDMFYENNMLQGEVDVLRIRLKAMQETIDALTLKNTDLLVEKANNSWIVDKNSDMSTMVHKYLQEIEELRSKLIESNNMCEQLQKQLIKVVNTKQGSSLDISIKENLSIIEEAKKELNKEKEFLMSRSELENDFEENENETDSDEEKNDMSTILKDELFSLTNDINMKQKLIDELELSQRRIQKMRQHYEDKLVQLQLRIKRTQEERDKVIHSYTTHPEPTENVKKIKDEYTKKLSDMQKELKKLQAAQKEHIRIIKNQSLQDNQLKSYKNELLEMKHAKVRLINKMKEESHRHKEAELKRIREIAQLKKESRKNANVIKTMETEKRIKDQVLKRKQEEVSLLRRSQRGKLHLNVGGKGVSKAFLEKYSKEKWRKVEKSINNIAMSRRGLVEQEVRMEHFLEKRESLGRELEVLEERKKQAIDNDEDITQLESCIEDIKENINYVQETLQETQRNIIDLEDTQDVNENANVQDIVESICDINEAKYIITKLYNMSLSESQMVAQKDAKLKENEATFQELREDSNFKGQLLDHILHNQIPIFSNDLMRTSASNHSNDMSSTHTSRSSSPADNNMFLSSDHNLQNKSRKIRRRTAHPSELLFGLHTEPQITSK